MSNAVLPEDTLPFRYSSSRWAQNWDCILPKGSPSACLFEEPVVGNMVPRSMVAV